MSFGRVYMRIFDAHIHVRLLNTYIWVQNTHISIWVQDKHIYAYKTRIYLRTKRAYASELLVLSSGITNSIQKILIRKQGEKQGGMVSYCKILH